MNEALNSSEETQELQTKNETITQEKTPRLFNRRTILKGLFFGGLAAATPSMARAADEQAARIKSGVSETTAVPETLPAYTKCQFIMDFAPAFEQDVVDFDHHTPADIIAEYPSDSSTWAHELVTRAGMNWEEAPQELKDTLLTAIGMFDKKYSRHAIDVADAATVTYEQTLDIQRSQYDIYPLQRTASLVAPEYQDSLGNTGIQIEFSADDIIAAAKQRSEKIISISSQPGWLTFIKEKNVRAIPQENLDSNHVYPITVEGQQRYILGNSADMNWQYDVIQNKPETETKDGAIVVTSSSTIYLDKVSENGMEKWVRVDTGEEVQLHTQEELAGHFEKVYSDNEQIITRDTDRLDWEAPYVGEHALRNFKEALRTARECPDKLWIYSAGNESEEIGQLKAQVIADGEEIPENILFVAQLDKVRYSESGEVLIIKPTHNVWGADLYVDNYDFDVEKDGSSFSAPIVSSIAQSLADQGMSPIEIKNKLLELGEVHHTMGSRIVKSFTEAGVTYNRVPTYKMEEVRVLDRQKVMFELNNQGWANSQARG